MVLTFVVFLLSLLTMGSMGDAADPVVSIQLFIVGCLIAALLPLRTLRTARLRSRIFFYESLMSESAGPSDFYHWLNKVEELRKLRA